MLGETKDEEGYWWARRRDKPRGSPGPASLCLPAAVTDLWQPLGALHVLLERWAPLLCFLLTEAEVCHFRPG